MTWVVIGLLALTMGMFITAYWQEASYAAPNRLRMALMLGALIINAGTLAMLLESVL